MCIRKWMIIFLSLNYHFFVGQRFCEQHKCMPYSQLAGVFALEFPAPVLQLKSVRSVSAMVVVFWFQPLLLSHLSELDTGVKH